MFGATVSTSVKDEQTLEKKRSQETRYKIFREISAYPSSDRTIRLADIANTLNENLGLISLHLGSLNNSGVISYETTGKGSSHASFKLRDASLTQIPEQFRHEKTLSAKVYDILNQFYKQRPDEYLSTEELVVRIIKEYPEYTNRKMLNGLVAAISTHFEKQDYVRRERFSDDFKSVITLSDEQREAITSLIIDIDNFKNGERQTKDEGMRFSQRVASDPSLFSELMLKAKEASPFANRTSKEEMNSWIISIIEKYPNSTRNQIQQLLEEDFDKRLTANGIRHHLRTLVKAGKILAEKTKAGNVYRLA